MANKSLSLKLKERFDDQSEINDTQPNKKIKTNTIISIINETHLLNNFNLNRLKSEFFNQNCIQLSRNLLGKYLIRNIESKCLIGKIVECEAYLGGSDKASHSFNGKKTERTAAMYMNPGTCYVYNIYGMYCCMNISAKEDGAGVLIRAVEPIHGIELMKEKRKSKENLKNLTNGPSKFCMAFNITKNEFNKEDLATNQMLWLQDDIDLPISDFKIIKAKRVGIDYAGEEAINQLYRFYIKDNKFVSKKCKIEIEELN